jgi:hypothetical protein
MAQKMLFCSTNISTEILLHLLGCEAFALYTILPHVLQNLVAFKCIKNNVRKRCSALEANFW